MKLDELDEINDEELEQQFKELSDDITFVLIIIVIVAALSTFGYFICNLIF